MAFFAPLSAAELATLTSRGVNATQGNDGLAFLQSLTGIVARTGDQTLLFPKVDWQINNNHALAVSYNHLRWNSPAGVQTAATVFNGVDNWGNDGVSDDWVIGRFNSVLGSRLTNEVRFQWGRDFEFQSSQPAIPGEPVVPGTTRSPSSRSSARRGFSFGKPKFLERTSYPDERRIQVADTATLLWNTHLVKFGVDINRTHDTLDNLFQEGGVYNYNSRADFISDYELNIKLARAGRFYSTFGQGIGPTAFEFATVDYAVFIQDTWHVQPRVTINWGLRYDYEQMPDPQIPNPLEPRTGAFPSDKNNWGPRMGVNWDVTGKGDTISARRIRDVLRAHHQLDDLERHYQYRHGGWAAPAVDSSDSDRAPALSQCPRECVGESDPGQTSCSLQPGHQNPLIHQFDLIFDQRIAPNTVLSVSWWGVRGGTCRFSSI